MGFFKPKAAQEPKETKESKFTGIKNMAKVLSLAFLGLSATHLESSAQGRQEGPRADLARSVHKMAYEVAEKNPDIVKHQGRGPEINIGHKNQVTHGMQEVIVGGYDKLTYVASSEEFQDGQVTRHNTMIIDSNQDGSPDLFLDQSIKQDGPTMAVKDVTPGVIEFADGTIRGDIAGDPSFRKQQTEKADQDARFRHQADQVLRSINMDTKQVTLDDIKNAIASQTTFEVSTINELSPEEQKAANEGFEKVLKSAEQALEKMNQNN